MEGAPAHALAAAASLNLGLPFDMIYSLKDSTPQMLSVFFDRLCLHLDPLPAEQFALIPFKVGLKFDLVFGFPVVVQQFLKEREGAAQGLLRIPRNPLPRLCQIC